MALNRPGGPVPDKYDLSGHPPVSRAKLIKLDRLWRTCCRTGAVQRPVNRLSMPGIADHRRLQGTDHIDPATSADRKPAAGRSADHLGHVARSFSDRGRPPSSLFTLFDPAELGMIRWLSPILTRMGGYTVGFFCFWLLTSISCAMTCYFPAPANRINQPKQPTES